MYSIENVKVKDKGGIVGEDVGFRVEYVGRMLGFDDGFNTTMVGMKEGGLLGRLDFDGTKVGLVLGFDDGVDDGSFVTLGC